MRKLCRTNDIAFVIHNPPPLRRFHKHYSVFADQTQITIFDGNYHFALFVYETLFAIIDYSDNIVVDILCMFYIYYVVLGSDNFYALLIDQTVFIAFDNPTQSIDKSYHKSVIYRRHTHSAFFVYQTHSRIFAIFVVSAKRSVFPAFERYIRIIIGVGVLPHIFGLVVVSFQTVEFGVCLDRGRYYIYGTGAVFVHLLVHFDKLFVTLVLLPVFFAVGEVLVDFIEQSFISLHLDKKACYKKYYQYSRRG